MKTLKKFDLCINRWNSGGGAGERPILFVEFFTDKMNRKFSLEQAIFLCWYNYLIKVYLLARMLPEHFPQKCYYVLVQPWTNLPSRNTKTACPHLLRYAVDRWIQNLLCVRQYFGEIFYTEKTTPSPFIDKRV